MYQTLLQLLESPLARSIFWAVALIAVTAIVARVATHTTRKLLRLDSNPLPTSSIIVNIVRATVWILGVTTVLDACFNVPVSSIVAALGVGGIAVSLGFQDTLANLIGGLQVTFMGIVKPGDHIAVGAETGVVQDVSWRHTTIRDALGQTIIIPNSIISTTALVHLLPANRVAVPFAIPRQRAEAAAAGDEAPSLDALTDQVAALARAAAETVSPVIDGPRVFLSEITEFGVKGKIVFQIADRAETSRAADACVRAIARELL